MATAGAAALNGSDTQRIDETLSRIQHHKGVIAVLVLSSEGSVIRSNLENVQSLQYANQLSQLCVLARNCVRDINPEDDLRVLRVRTTKNEIMISPAQNYFLVVVQNPEDP